MFKSINPASGVEVATYPEIGSAEVEQKLGKAVIAFKTWKQLNFADRQALLGRIAETFEANKDRLAAMATLEMGKTLVSAVAEIEKCVAVFRFYAAHGAEHLQSTVIPLPNNKTAETTWLPLGPILAIMPWKLPFFQVARFIAPFVMARQRRASKTCTQCSGLRCSA